MRRLLFACLCVGTLYPAPAMADPVVLGTGTFGIGFGAGSPDIQNGPMHFSMTIMPGFAQPGPTLFELTLTNADNGREFLSSASTDPDFTAFAGFLTNGRNDEMSIGYLFDDGLGITDSIAEDGVFTIPDGVTASMIKAIRLRFDELHIATFPGDEREVGVNATLSVEGVSNPVPEPATLVLVIGGLVAMRRRVRLRSMSASVLVDCASQ